MRGRIIHYNANDGKGLISADNKQFPFEISQWQSESAPALNAVVDMDIEGERPTAVRRVTDEVLMREKAAEFGGKLGALGTAALRSASGAAVSSGVGNLVSRIGKPALIWHAVFVFGALVLRFITTDLGVPGYSLVGLSENPWVQVAPLSELLVWASIVSPLLPIFWHNRKAWLGLLLPVLATIWPMWGIRAALAVPAENPACKNVDAFSPLYSECATAGMHNQTTQMLSEHIHTGIGFMVCLVAAVALAVIGIKHFLRTPAN